MYIYPNENLNKRTTYNYLERISAYSSRIIQSDRIVNICWKKNYKRIKEISQLSKETPFNIKSELLKNKKYTKQMTNEKKTKKENKEYDSDATNSASDIEKETIINEESDNDEEMIQEENNAFWQIIRKIMWYDRDEGIRCSNDIHRNINRIELIFIKSQINSRFIPLLKSVLLNTPLFENLDERDQYNIMTHIILKGKEFYNGIIQNPFVSLYLFEQYYPAYDWMNLNRVFI